MSEALPPALDVQTTVGWLLLHRDDEVITQNLVRWGVWEAAETGFLRKILKPGDTLVLGLAAYSAPGWMSLRMNETNRGDGVRSSRAPVDRARRQTATACDVR